MISTVFLAWRDPGRRWFPVGRLSVSEEAGYSFVYIRGALEAIKSGFQPLAAFPDLEREYTSEALFPVFRDRVLSSKRAEYAEFVSWLNLSPPEADPLVLLATTHGKRETDTFEVYARPERNVRGEFEVRCFVHGLKHRKPEEIERAATLAPGEHLYVESEPDNVADRLAVKTLTTCEARAHVGYLPRYLSADAHSLGIENLSVTVERVNPAPVPIRFRVLCRIVAPWPAGFRPLSGDAYQPLRRQTNGGDSDSYDADNEYASAS